MLQHAKSTGVHRPRPLLLNNSTSHPSNRPVTKCQASSQHSNLATQGLAAVLAFTLTASTACATGLESIDILPQSFEKPAALAGLADDQQSKLTAAEETFQQSSTLKDLLAKSAANKEKNKKDIMMKYCYRQAELGIGDCGGLRYIPGLTQNGKQKTPKWLGDLLGVEVPEEKEGTVTMKSLFGDNAPN